MIPFLSVNGQQPTVKNFSTSEYGGGTQNWCMSQMADKRMLFANNSGLMLFDSERWFLYPVPNYTNVRSIFYDRHDNIVYVGASNEFGCYYVDPITYQTRYVSISAKLPAKEHDFNEVWNICKYEGDIVFQCKRHIFTLHHNRKLMITHVPFSVEKSAVIGDKLIVACREMIYYMCRGKLKELPFTKELQGMRLGAIMPFPQGRILFATASNGIYLYDGHTTLPLPLDITPFLRENQVFCGALKDNLMAIGTVRGGVVVKNILTGQNFYSNVMTGLQNNTVLSIFFDSRDNVWLGLDQGISCVLIDTPYKELFGNSSQCGTGYASLISGNKFYMGTNQGLFVALYPIPNSPTPEKPLLLPGMVGQVWSIRDMGGSILCGNNDGAYQIYGMTARRISGPEGTWDFIPLRSHSGYVLSCDYQGLYILKNMNGRWTFINRVSGFNETSASFIEDTDGSIWVSHWQKGVFHLWLSSDLKRVVKSELYNVSNQLLTNYNNVISKVDGKIYISSSDGFRYYDEKIHRLCKDEAMDRLFGSMPMPLRLYETSKRDIWAVNNGNMTIARRNSNGQCILDSLSYRAIAKRLQTWLGHICFDGDNNTIFNVENGFVTVSNVFSARKNTARLFISRVVSTNTQNAVLYIFTTNSKKNIRIPHGQNSIKIEFVWPEYNSDKAVTYSYYLENYDTRWSNPQSVSSKEYTQLGKGTYVFHVRAYNSVSGLTQETTLTITILPAWYETWWAYTIYVIIVFVILFYIYKYVKYRYERRVRAIEVRRQRELKEKEAQFEIERQKKEKELMKLRNEQLELDLKHKTSELADSTMNLIRKNDMLQSLNNDLDEISNCIHRENASSLITRKIHNLHLNIQSNIKEDENWEKFEENFNLVYDNYMKKLCEKYPQLKINDRKLCAYLRMGLSSKEIASLMNTSVRSIETARYRLRRKLDLDHDNNLADFMQSFE